MSILSNEAIAAAAARPAITPLSPPTWAERQESDAAFQQWILDAATREAREAAAQERAEYESGVCGIARQGLEHRLEAEIAELAQVPELATRSRYIADFKRFKALCDEAGLTALPAAPETVALFIEGEFEAGKGMPRLRGIAAAIAWVHDRYGKPDPTDDILVRAMLRHAVKHSKPSTPDDKEG
jgi:hypothetical protein